MKYTWGEVQIISIEKMFLNTTKLTTSDLPVMREDKRYLNYLGSMGRVANEGLLRLMSVGKPLIKKYTLSHYLPDDIISAQSRDTYTVINDDVEVMRSNGHAYYFEVNDTCEITIELYNGSTWDIIETINHLPDKSKRYTTYKNIINNPNDAINNPVALEIDNSFAILVPFTNAKCPIIPKNAPIIPFVISL